ncbi:hypothetical protein [Rhizobium sp. PDO1-076]|uniref:hypothetical protein n=1 Tax=Rhizobium sp. PDO1-076 TaxID=1125979 RepID=UPI00114790CA|nr:hypothetical protein [Rhizobium sp. PDO1-076]
MAAFATDFDKRQEIEVRTSKITCIEVRTSITNVSSIKRPGRWGSAERIAVGASEDGGLSQS